MTRKVRIALIMGGGVSLGTFSAGALSRVVELLRHYRDTDADVRIDVMSGASAGSMTLGMVLYRLFVGGASDAEVDAGIVEDLRKAWIDPSSVGIQRLMEPHQDPSLIGEAVTREVAERLIDLDAELSSPHSLFAEGTLISMALTNLNGFPARAEGQMIAAGHTGGGVGRGRASVFADALQTTFHHDRIRFAVHRNPDDHARAQARSHHARVLAPWTRESDGDKGGWSTFITAALASGAFPIAFRPVDLERHAFEYREGEWPFAVRNEDGSYTHTRESFVFSYVDGGVTRNEPIREAIQLAGIRDRDESDVERLFILIDPHLSGTGEDYTLPHTRPEGLAPDGTPIPASPSTQMVQVGASLMGLLSNQASYREWLRVAGYNRYTEWFADNREAIAELGETLSAEQKAKMRAILGSFEDREAQLEDGERESEGGAEPDPLVRLVKRFLDIERKRTLRMVAITPNSIRADRDRALLKGAFLSNFGGFFDEAFRQHDFDVGRSITDLVMREPLGDGTSLLGESNEPLPPIQMDDAAHRDYLSIPHRVRREFDQWLTERTRTLTRDLTGSLISMWIDLGNSLAAMFGRDMRRSLRRALERYEGVDQVDVHLILTDAPVGASIDNVEAERDPRSATLIARVRIIRDRHYPPQHFFRFKESRSSDDLYTTPRPLTGQVRRPGSRGSGSPVQIPIEGTASDWFAAAEGMRIPFIQRPWTQSEPLRVDELGDRA